jgi:hypothetical protein
MKKAIISFAVFGLVTWQGLAWADGAEDAEVCMSCHELAQFQGMDAAELAAGEASSDDEMMQQIVAGLSPEQLQAAIEYIAAQANQ